MHGATGAEWEIWRVLNPLGEQTGRVGALDRLRSGLGGRQGCVRREAPGADSRVQPDRTTGSDEGIFIRTRLLRSARTMRRAACTPRPSRASPCLPITRPNSFTSTHFRPPNPARLASWARSRRRRPGERDGGRTLVAHSSARLHGPPQSPRTTDRHSRQVEAWHRGACGAAPASLNSMRRSR